MTTKWLANYNADEEPSLRLFCFPYAGGGASLFRGWNRQMDRRVAVCPVRLPGREMRLRDAPISDLKKMLDEIVDALAPYLCQPYAMFGHSMGAILAYESAALAQRRGLGLPKHLFVSARQAPTIERQMIPVPVSTLSDDEFLSYLRRDNSVTEAFDNPELKQLVLPTLRADFEVCQSYRGQYHPKFDFPITAFVGSDDSHVSVEDMEGWRDCTTGSFRLRIISGDHFFISNPTEVIREMEDELGPAVFFQSVSREGSLV